MVTAAVDTGSLSACIKEVLELSISVILNHNGFDSLVSCLNVWQSCLHLNIATVPMLLHIEILE